MPAQEDPGGGCAQQGHAPNYQGIISDGLLLSQGSTAIEPVAKPAEPASLKGLDVARRFFAGTAGTYDTIVHLWTFGLDRYWKKKIVARIPHAPLSLIDQACGTGILTLRLARRFPGCRIIGVDLNWEYLALAKRKAKSLGVGNLEFVLGRAEDAVFKGHFDCITSSYLAKYADMEKLIRAAAKMLTKGGLLVMHDFTYPRNPLARHALSAYFWIMQRVGSRLSPEWRTVFFELEDFLKRSRWVPELIFSLERSGFEKIRAERLTLGFAAIISAVKT